MTLMEEILENHRAEKVILWIFKVRYFTKKNILKAMHEYALKRLFHSFKYEYLKADEYAGIEGDIASILLQELGIDDRRLDSPIEQLSYLFRKYKKNIIDNYEQTKKT